MLKLSIAFRLRLSLAIAIGSALLQTGAWLELGIYGAIACLWSLALKTPKNLLTKLLGAELICLSLLALPLGWERAIFLLIRSLICLLAMNSFLLTLPPHSFGVALSSLPLPTGIKEIVLLAGQYLEILLSEVTKMQRAAKCRGLSGSSGWLRYASAAMIGSLYLRSFDRAERVYGAMVIRGYQGRFPGESKLSSQERLGFLVAISIATIITLTSYLKFTG
ncbi:cobalt transporter [Oscillatoriales cyanobacterium USR001]|nr:cobalt transporter [Oscillatoriales cyanobacterium USR001]